MNETVVADFLGDLLLATFWLGFGALVGIRGCGMCNNCIRDARALAKTLSVRKFLLMGLLFAPAFGVGTVLRAGLMLWTGQDCRGDEK